LFPTQENDVLKLIQAFFSTTGLPTSYYPDSHPPTNETAIFVMIHLKKRLFSLPRGLLLLVHARNPETSDISDFFELARW
jgi:hypothetical protein